MRMFRSQSALLAILLGGCVPAGSGDDKDTAEDDGRVPEVPFDPACVAQVMFTQTICQCTEITVDWSGLTADSAGATLDPSSGVNVVHWYILGMPVSSLNGRLCDDTPLEADVLGGDAEATNGATEAAFEIGEWDYGAGVIALYDTLDEASGADPRAAAIFAFDPESTSSHLTVVGRGDVWTAP